MTQLLVSIALFNGFKEHLRERKREREGGGTEGGMGGRERREGDYQGVFLMKDTIIENYIWSF